MSTNVSSSSFIKILILVSLSSFAYRCSTGVIDKCPPQTFKGLKRAFEKVKNGHAPIPGVIGGFSSGEIPTDEAMYYLMSHAIVDGAKLHMDSLERFIENESTIHALCAPLKGVAKVYSATGDFHCSKAAKDIYNCLKNYGSEFKVSSSSSSGITGVLKLLLNAFG